MNKSSSKTTIEDIENAVKFINKELSVKDIEDIYGDFNDPRFQAALKMVKSNLGDIVRSLNLRSLTLLRIALEKNLQMLTRAIEAGKTVISETIADYRTTVNKKFEYISSYIAAAEEMKTEVAPSIYQSFKEDLDTVYYSGKVMLHNVRTMATSIEKWKAEKKEESAKLSLVEKQIYATQLQTLVNVLQGMFTIVLDNIIY